MIRKSMGNCTMWLENDFSLEKVILHKSSKYFIQSIQNGTFKYTQRSDNTGNLGCEYAAPSPGVNYIFLIFTQLIPLSCHMYGIPVAHFSYIIICKKSSHCLHY